MYQRLKLFSQVSATLLCFYGPVLDGQQYLSLSPKYLILNDRARAQQPNDERRPRGIHFNPPDLQITLPKTAGGGSPGCSQSDKPLTALIPTTKIGITASKYPTFFFYIPQTSAQSAEFILLDEESGDIVYETTFNISGTSGIISISLPDKEILKPLEIGKNYTWVLSLICNPQDRAGDTIESGFVQRIELIPALVSELEKAKERDRPAIYAAAGIWYDTLTSLADLRRANPKDATLATDWEDLLKQVGLAEIAKEPPLENSVKSD